MTVRTATPPTADRLMQLGERLLTARDMMSRLERSEAENRRGDAAPAAEPFELAWALREELEDIAAGLTAPPASPEDLRDTVADTRPPDGLAVMVGHSRASPGAEALSPPFPADDRAEYGWNADLARRILAIATAQGIRCKIFTRDGTDIAGSYIPVRAFRPRATVELHFNASDNASASGSLTLYGSGESEAWARALQDKMVALYDRRGHREDRGIQMPGPGSGYARGTQNVVQIHPSALIEPFFGSNREDAERGLRLKEQLAEAVVAAYAVFAGLPVRPQGPGADDTRPGGGPLPETRPTLPGGALFARLYQSLTAMTLALPDLDAETAKSLKSIVLAQWAEESGWGTSRLAAEHFNFAGMKALSEVGPILEQLAAQKVWYEAHDGFDWYLRFAGPEDFIKGYFMFLDRSPYRGWRAAARRSPHDFIRFIGRVWSNGNPGYADRIIALERRILAAAPAGEDAGGAADDGGTAGGSEGGLNLEALPADARLFRDLLAHHMPTDADLVRMKAVLAAQWAVESNFGRSALAVQHFNFAGIEWAESLGDVAVRIPHPTNPEKGDFCRFLSLDHFADACLRRLERQPAFSGWRAASRTAEDFIAFLAATWRPADSSYAQALTTRLRLLSRTPPPPHDLGGEAGPGPAVTQQGFVLHLQRTHCERRRDKTYDRTVGTYSCFFNGAPLAGLTGMAFERQGPGDNGPTGTQNGRRIRAGSYALSTHAGNRTDAAGVTLYKTIGFSPSTAVGQAPRPSVRLLDTGAREGILFHPGQDYVWSTGCFNFSSPLPSGGAMDWDDSRAHVIAVIEGMRSALGARFPGGNNVRIGGVTMVIEGEPGPAGGGDSPVMSSAAFGLQQLDAVRATLASPTAAPPTDPEIYHLAASALIGSAEAGVVEDGTFDAVIETVPDLKALRKEDGATLWSAFVTACAVAGTLTNLAVRGALLARFATIAGVLADRGVPLDGAGAAHAPAVEAAMADSPAALGILVRVGADLDAHDRSGLTPLLAAAFFGSADALSWLIDAGADTQAVTSGGAPQAAMGAEGETLPAGLSARVCAEEGKRRAAGDLLLDRYEAVISLLWNLEN